MNKDVELKKDPWYDSFCLRNRVGVQKPTVGNNTAGEWTAPRVKKMPFIPVTGLALAHKYTHNKSPKAY